MKPATKPIFIEAVGLAAPGLPSWQQARAALRGEQPCENTPLPPHTPALLPANERRRATPAIRLAFQAAEDAMQGTSIPAANLATVFASSDADLGIIHRISLALTASPRFISPTDFHNSVHNAAAGYWSIAVGSRAASTTISAYDGSFAAGLLEASLLVEVDACDVLLVAFDLPAPEPLHAKRPIAHPVAVALVLTQQATAKTLAALSCATTMEPETLLPDAALESLRSGNPAARALPLLQRLAARDFGRVILPNANSRNLAVDLHAP
ncbi:MAG TPA: beta-ketoacyl synthase chain length factor [Povalibacter sp.]|uniref:beta-ketoacyl synthase chain length factor n=1 Tax=Povalibacter sp. TaxID=1962978 RepID=UPI002CDB9E61|nr:beta-ketoacyl synthase chain length factor [Povalibacter sp.]HMN44790.1 beta-ketoacyl synthase chain length factor [Povalibacter sp.]